MSADDQAQGSPLIGRTVAQGRYEVLAFLGAGGMGAVYRAMQHPLERLVALKLIHRDFAGDASVLGRFEREMRVTASIEHPHTVRVYDYGQIDGQPFLAMEFLDGRTLRDVLASSGPLPVGRLAHIGTQIAKALRAAHAAGIIHRDLKPENVMLLDSYGEQDFVKVLDFGIARPLREEAGYRTAAGVLVGTPTYMSPEQASDTPVDPRSDLYTLGVMLYEMACGEPPFRGTALTALLYAHASQPPPPLHERAPQLPLPVEQLIMRLLEKQPDARPGNAEAIVAALAPFVTAGAQQWLTPGGRAPLAPPAPLASLRPSGAPTMPEASGPAPVRGQAAALGTERTALQVDAASGAGETWHPPGGDGRPSIGGTISLPSHTGRAEDVTASRDQKASGSSGKRRLLILGAATVGVVLAIGAVIAWRGVARERPKEPEIPGHRLPGEAPATTGDSPSRGALAKVLAPLLQLHGEPPWPAACQSVAAAPLPTGLAEAVLAMAAVPAVPASAAGRGEVQARLAAVGDVPERWLVAARLALPEDAPGAVAAARKAVAACPSSAVAHNLLGNALQRQQAWDQAAAAYAEAHRLVPDYRAPAFNAGLVALRGGDVPKALAAFDELVAADPTQPNLFLVRADAQRMAGHAEAALADLREHVRRHPDSADGWYQLGRALSASKGPGATDAFCQARDLGHPEAAALCKAAPSGMPRRRGH